MSSISEKALIDANWIWSGIDNEEHDYVTLVFNGIAMKFYKTLSGAST
jgi:hypothetical protein